MHSVTSVITIGKIMGFQPYGGFIPAKAMDKEELETNRELNTYTKEEDKGLPTIIGLSVDYLSRLIYTEDSIEDVFYISIEGYKRIHNKNPKLKQYNDLSDESIIQAYMLSQYDSAVRAGYFDIEEKKPNQKVIEDVRLLTKRTLDFYNSLEDVSVNFTFGDPTGETRGGYTTYLSSGDGDFLSKDTLWDLKVTKSKPNKNHTLQVLLYFLMGKASGQEKFKDLTHIGIYNPKLNTKYTYKVDNLSRETLDKVYECYLQQPIVTDEEAFGEELEKYTKVLDSIKAKEETKYMESMGYEELEHSEVIKFEENDNLNNIIKWGNGKIYISDEDKKELFVDAIEGDKTVNIGDYIVKDIYGCFHTMDSGKFHRYYTTIEEDENVVGKTL